MALKRQPIAQAIDPMAAIKKFPMPKAPTTWNARHPLTPLLKKKRKR
jgi:hypothetical protein